MSLLDQVIIASPCSASWASMPGDDKVRQCGACSKNVFNLSGMSRSEAEDLLRNNRGSKCLRIVRRKDGTVMTDECPVRLRKIRDSYRMLGRLVSIVLGAIFSGSAMAQEHNDRTPMLGEMMESPAVVPTKQDDYKREPAPASNHIKLRATMNIDKQTVELYNQAKLSDEQGKFLLAQTLYQKALKNLPVNADPKLRELITKDLHELTRKIGTVLPSPNSTPSTGGQKTPDLSQRIARPIIQVSSHGETTADFATGKWLMEYDGWLTFDSNGEVLISHPDFLGGSCHRFVSYKAKWTYDGTAIHIIDERYPKEMGSPRLLVVKMQSELVLVPTNKLNQFTSLMGVYRKADQRPDRLRARQ